MASRRVVLVRAEVAVLAVAALLGLFLGLMAGGRGAPPAEVPFAAKGEIELRVMTFNILSADGDVHVGAWDDRRDSVVHCIREFAPDVLGTQEVQGRQADYLRRELSEYAYVGAGRRDGRDKGRQNPILYRRDRFESVREGHFWLSETPDVPGSRDWFSVTPRMTTWVELRLRAHPAATVFAFNTHFDSVSWHARHKSAELLAEKIRGIAGDRPVIVTGDFNTPTGARTYATLVADEERGKEALRLIDSYRSIYPEGVHNEGTYRLPAGVRLNRRIDWILHTPHFSSVDARILTNKALDRYPSDHFPVTAVLRGTVPSAVPAGAP